MRSPAGLKIQYLRDSKDHTLRTIRSGAGIVSLDYDSQQRIARARGGDQEVRYEYDEGGRLTRVEESSGTVRRYTYNVHGAMLSIDEPRWHIENSYDDGGRCVHQVTRWPDGSASTLDVAYKLEKGSIVEATKSWNGGPRTVYHFNGKQYLESEERDPDGGAPVVISYGRNAFSNISTGITVR